MVVSIPGSIPLSPNGCHKTTALESCDSGRFTDNDHYGKKDRSISNQLNHSVLTDIIGQLKSIDFT